MDIQKPTPAPTSIRKFILRWCSASSTVRTAMRSYFSAVKLTNNMCPSSDSMTLTSQSADPQTLSREVSLSIALHTTPTIAKRAGTLPYLIRTAVLLDFNDDKRMEFNLQCLQNELETQLPRLECLQMQMFVSLLLKAPKASWSRQLLDTHTRDPRWNCDNPGF